MRLVPGAVCLIAAIGVGCAPVPDQAADRRPLASPRASSRAAGPAAADVLHRWDAARARAWEAGDARALARLYLPGTVAGARDVAMLRRWSARGWQVDHLGMQLLAVRTTVHKDRRIVMVVTDRLTGAVATRNGVRRPLPAGLPTTRTIDLRLVGGEWRVAGVAG